MFSPNYGPESVKQMKASIPTATGHQLVEFLVECVNAAALSNGIATPYYELAHLAELELKKRLENV